MHVAARKRCLGALDGGCVSAARLVVVDLSKLDLRSYAGSEHADAAWVRPASPSRRLGPRKVAVVLIWFWSARLLFGGCLCLLPTTRVAVIALKDY